MAVFSTLSVALLGVPVLAQGHPDQGNAEHHDAYVKHSEWKKGYHLNHDDWARGARVDDWKAHHLRQPPRGYEWRTIDGNYVLADINTGVINTVVAIP